MFVYNYFISVLFIFSFILNCWTVTDPLQYAAMTEHTRVQELAYSDQYIVESVAVSMVTRACSMYAVGTTYDIRKA